MSAEAHRRRAIALAAGGTGGHLFPAQALAAELVRRGRRVVLLTDKRTAGFEDRFQGVEVHVVRAATFANAGALAKARALADIGAGTLAARKLLRRLDVAAAVGFGGYPSLPPMLAATMLRLPAMLHEQNAVLGRVNRLLAPRVDAVALSFESTVGLRAEDESKRSVTGNPVRPAIVAVRELAYVPPNGEGPLRLLVLGGSQGAQILSDVVPAALAALPPELRSRLRVTQQCRPEDLERVRAAYRESGIVADLAAFIDDVPALLGACHLAITRAGASTVAELAVAGRPSILVPYKHATDDHQTANARALAAAGGAFVMPQDKFTAATLADSLSALLIDAPVLGDMAKAARAAGVPDAAARLADLVESLAPANGASDEGRAAA